MRGIFWRNVQVPRDSSAVGEFAIFGEMCCKVAGGLCAAFTV